MNARILAGCAVAAVFTLVAPARAQTSRMETPTDKPLETPTRAPEFYGATGFTQGFGSLQSGLDVGHVVTGGFATELGAGYRFDPHWALSLFGQYAEFDAQRATSARGLVVGAFGAYHFTPYRKLDPWVQVGAGYRFLWESEAATNTTVTTHGLELGRITVGVDMRATRDIAFAPLVGVDLTLPLSVSDPRLSTFLFAGMQGRFDLGGAFVGGPRPVATTQVTQAITRPPPPPARPLTPTITASDEVLTACKSLIDEVDTAPKLELDESVLLPADFAVLEKVAECFATGPLKNAGVVLVGRADAVATFFEQRGVDRARVERVTRAANGGRGDRLSVEIRIRAEAQR